MKIKEMLEEAARLDTDIGNDIYAELFMSMSECCIKEPALIKIRG